MGRSFLSIKLAAVFGVLVAAAVTAQERSLQRELDQPAMTAGAAALAPVRTVEVQVGTECLHPVTEPGRTPPATARASRAAAAKQS